ncbi:hypothetical protein [Ktedonobacter sp. SOSP1-85]|uniref:hypothetical protein n=1 Tax=Ktedonobacter sp. SOSP1-85 TaxID=2778367 RepID=UPI0019166717|nr:hypothetical protein [Ktedonobacter sp. SOSP1-85]
MKLQKALAIQEFQNEFTPKERATMRRLLTTIILAGLLSAVFMVGAVSAHTHQPASCTYWATDAETIQTINGYRWDVSLLSFRACGSGAYLGKVSDHDCVTVPPHQPFDLLMWNQWYINGNYINETSYRFYPPYNSASGPYCSYSGSFSVPSGSNVMNYANLQYLDNSHIAGYVLLTDYNVH